MTTTEKEQIYTDLKKYTYVRMTTDPKENLARRKASLVSAEAYSETFGKKMIDQKILMDIALEQKEALRKVNIEKQKLMKKAKEEAALKAIADAA